MPCPNISAAFEEGDIAEVFFKRGKIINATTGKEIKTTTSA